MSTLPTRIEREAGSRLEASEIVNITAARERALSRMLMLYISTGVMFMLLPGTFLWVWDLLTISSHRAANSVSPACNPEGCSCYRTHSILQSIAVYRDTIYNRALVKR